MRAAFTLIRIWINEEFPFHNEKFPFRKIAKLLSLHVLKMQIIGKTGWVGWEVAPIENIAIYKGDLASGENSQIFSFHQHFFFFFFGPGHILARTFRSDKKKFWARPFGQAI